MCWPVSPCASHIARCVSLKRSRTSLGCLTVGLGSGRRSLIRGRYRSCSRLLSAWSLLLIRVLGMPRVSPMLGPSRRRGVGLRRRFVFIHTTTRKPPDDHSSSGPRGRNRPAQQGRVEHENEKDVARAVCWGGARRRAARSARGSRARRRHPRLLGLFRGTRFRRRAAVPGGTIWRCREPPGGRVLHGGYVHSGVGLGLRGWDGYV